MAASLSRVHDGTATVTIDVEREREREEEGGFGEDTAIGRINKSLLNPSGVVVTEVKLTGFFNYQSWKTDVF